MIHSLFFFPWHKRNFALDRTNIFLSDPLVCFFASLFFLSLFSFLFLIRLFLLWISSVAQTPSRNGGSLLILRVFFFHWTVTDNTDDNTNATQHFDSIFKSKNHLSLRSWISLCYANTVMQMSFIARLNKKCERTHLSDWNCVISTCHWLLK